MNFADESKKTLAVTLMCAAREERDHLASWLLKAQCDLKCVTSTEQMFEMLKAGTPDLVILCDNPQSGDVFQAARTMRKTCPGLQTALVAEDTNIPVLQTALASGFMACLHQPVTEEQVTDMLARCRVFAMRCSVSGSSCLLADLDPSHGILLVDHAHRITLRNAASYSQLHAQGLTDCPTFSVAAKRSFRDYCGYQVVSFHTAVENGHPWCGELAGVGPTSDCLFSCQIMAPPAEYGAACTVVIRDITSLTKEREQLWLEAGVNRDRLLLHKTSWAVVTRNAEPESFKLVPLVKQIFSSAGLPAMDLDVASCLPSTYIGNKEAMQELFSAFALHLIHLEKPSRLSLRLDLRTQNGNSYRLDCALGVYSAAISENSYLRITDYLHNMEGDSKVARKTCGLFLAEELMRKDDKGIQVKTNVGEQMVFSFAINLTASEADAENNCETLPNSEGTTCNLCLWTSHESVVLTEGLRILIADDSITDQMCLRALLEAEGYKHIVLTNNGCEALEELENGDYDLVFMDILMPQMDGFEAVRLLRQREDLTSTHTPVIALTSYALKAIQNKCLSVGMDGYLYKPVHKENLLQIFTQLQAEEPSHDAALPPQESVPIFNRDKILETMMGDENLVQKIAQCFLSDIPSQMALLEEYLDAQDVQGVERQAHMIKGAAANVSGMVMRDVAYTMEQSAKSSDLKAVANKIPELKQQFAHLKEAMQSVCAPES